MEFIALDGKRRFKFEFIENGFYISVGGVQIIKYEAKNGLL